MFFLTQILCFFCLFLSTPLVLAELSDYYDLPAVEMEAAPPPETRAAPGQETPKPRVGRVPRPAPASQKNDPLDFLPDLKSKADFERLARTYFKGKFYKIPHLMFALDRFEKRVYWIQSKKYDYHQDFMWAKKLSVDNADAFFQHNYLDKNRRFMVGNLAYYPDLDRFAFEFWEGDLLHQALLKDAYAILSAHFFTALAFKPNSMLHERVWEELVQSLESQVESNPASNPESNPASNPESNPESFPHSLPESQMAQSRPAITVEILSRFPILKPSEINSNKDYQPIQLGKAVGRLRFLKELSPDTFIGRDEIVVFEKAPFQVTPLAGMITIEPSSPLSHLSLLAANWKIPYASIRDAKEKFGPLENQYVRLTVDEYRYQLVEASTEEIKALKKRIEQRAVQVTPKVDLEFKELTALVDQRAKDANRFGSKSANLGELIAAKSKLFKTPSGFTVPFYFYGEFLRQNGLEQALDALLGEPRFKTDPLYRKEALADFRKKIEQGTLSESFRQAILQKIHQEFSSKGFFIRSSTNSEDLPGFSGAGLYTTVPNVREDEKILEAIKIVWASLWNFEAYEAREAFGMNHRGVFPAVIVQQAIPADCAGVAITADPFAAPPSNQSNLKTVLINAKKGLGIKVVEGKKQPEQLIYRESTNSIQRLRQSEETSALQFDEKGGVLEVPLSETTSVLTELQAWKLVWASLQVQKIFNGQAQDIEWLFVGDELFIVQARPYR